MTRTRPGSRQLICPVPELSRSNPVTGSPSNRAVAAQMYPSGTVIT
jgi:hypothetical protein